MSGITPGLYADLQATAGTMLLAGVVVDSLGHASASGLSDEFSGRARSCWARLCDELDTGTAPTDIPFQGFWVSVRRYGVDGALEMLYELIEDGAA